MGFDNPLHIAFLVVILLLLFGAKRLPEMGRSLGTGMREFKSSVTGELASSTAPASENEPSVAAGSSHATAPTSVSQSQP